MSMLVLYVNAYQVLSQEPTNCPHCMKNWFDWIGSAGEREEKDPKRTSVLYRQACIFVCEGVVGVFKATFKNTYTYWKPSQFIFSSWYILSRLKRASTLQSIYNRNVIRFWIRRETNRLIAESNRTNKKWNKTQRPKWKKNRIFN